MLIRSNQNPILTRKDIPELGAHLRDVSSVFNPGAIKVGNTYHLMLRVQNRGRETFLLMADSQDGIDFNVREEVINFKGIENISDKIYHIYDPRITQIDNIFYIMFAMDMEKGCRLGLAKSANLIDFKFMGIVSDHENRNGVLFPEMINGKYVRLDRPNLNKNHGVSSGSSIHLSWSLDMMDWSHSRPVMNGRHHYWDELIGAGPPPIKTTEGWLLIYHGIASHFASSNIYQAGVTLLDLQNPANVISRSKYNILEPRENYELTGQVSNVVFPSGMIVEDYDDDGFAIMDSNVKIYYGAADTCIGLAESTISELIGMAKND